jgi:transcriptional regulator of acetoin/glycerol metabolism
VLAICRDLLGDTARDTKSVFAVGDAEGVLLLVEGDPSARRQVECINFVEGAVWSEKQAGTNAPGTALELDAALQILAVEHYNEAVRPWSCAAAPIHDPDSGRLLGVIDLTGGGDVASPHALALVRAVARAAESELARRLALDDRRVRAAYDRRPRVRGTAALVSPGGRVLNATGDLQITGLS